MFEFSVDTSGPEKAIDGMLAKIDHFKRVDIGAELSAWQTENMHRHRPFTMRNRSKGRASTVIRPHSEFEVNRSRYAQQQHTRVTRLLAKPRKRPYRGAAAIYRTYRRWSTRPILREELRNILTERMSALMAKLLVWK